MVRQLWRGGISKIMRRCQSGMAFQWNEISTEFEFAMEKTSEADPVEWKEANTDITLKL